jgi:glutamate synthase (NADPH/NADH) large chain
VGVATQDPELIKKFTGQPEHVVNYFFFVAEEVREWMAKLGFRTFDEMIGRADLLDMRRGIEHWKAQGLDFSRLFHRPAVEASVAIHQVDKQDHGLDKALDHSLIEKAKVALEQRKPVQFAATILNRNRTVGAMLSGEVARRYGHAGLADDTIHVKFTGTAGQSFGAWLAKGITFELEGDGNDYVGKGLSGGRIVVHPPADCPIVPEDNIIVGNTVMYGAISGEAFFRGVAGERFCVRNSGATAVVEGVGDHACEYMTGGRAVILGPTGRNLAAGMSGGFAFVWDPEQSLFRRMNRDMVDIDLLDEEDGDWLRGIITQHLEVTGSEVAERLLSRWWSNVGSFAKVFPKDYKRVLEARRDAMERGVDADEAIMAAARG